MINPLNSIVAPPAAPETIQFVGDLVKLLADPAAAMERIEQYRAAASELRVAHERLREAQAAFAPAEVAHQQKLATERAAHDLEIKQAREALDAQRLTQETAAVAREKRLTELEAKAAATTEANEALRADLDRRLGLLKAAGAAA